MHPCRRRLKRVKLWEANKWTLWRNTPSPPPSERRDASSSDSEWVVLRSSWLCTVRMRVCLHNSPRCIAASVRSHRQHSFVTLEATADMLCLSLLPQGRGRSAAAGGRQAAGQQAQGSGQ